MSKGVYCLIINFGKDKRIKIGKLGFIDFKRGYYCYVGSALNNLEKRIERHKQENKNFLELLCPIPRAEPEVSKVFTSFKLYKQRKNKKLKWHIDYFLRYGKIVNVIEIKTNKKIECLVSKKMNKIADNKIKNFGCSDCKCKSHLYYFKSNPTRILQKVIHFKVV